MRMIISFLQSCDRHENENFFYGGANNPARESYMFGSLLHPGPPSSLTCDSFPQRGVGKVKMVRFLNIEQLGSFEQLALGVSA